MAAMYKKGIPPKVREKPGLPHSAVCRNPKSMGFDVVSRHTATEEQVDEWAALYESKTTIKEIAKHCGVSDTMVGNRLKKCGARIRT